MSLAKSLLRIESSTLDEANDHPFALQSAMMYFIKHFTVPILTVALHTLLVLGVRHGIDTSDDPMAPMAWIMFEVIDWPVALLLFPTNGDGKFFIDLLFFGGLQWFAIGLAVQCLWNCLSRAYKRDREELAGMAHQTKH